MHNIARQCRVPELFVVVHVVAVIVVFVVGVVANTVWPKKRACDHPWLLSLKGRGLEKRRFSWFAGVENCAGVENLLVRVTLAIIPLPARI